jgi:AraC-like DNA-binding protein
LNIEAKYFNLHPVNFLIISGILQGFVLSGILFIKKTDRSLSNRLISLTIFLVNLHLTYLIILDLNFDNMYPQLLWIPYSYLTAIGPLIFLYVRSLLEKQFKISKKEVILFLPLIIELIFQIIQIIYSIIHNTAYYNVPSDAVISIGIYITSILSIFYYFKLSLKAINSHEEWAKRNFSNLKEITLSWLYKLLSYYRILWLLWIPFAAIFLAFFRLQIQNFILILIIYFLMLAITYLTYWIGIEGVRRMDLIFFHSKEHSSSETKAYTNIEKSKIDSYIARVQQFMVEDRLYLNESLSLRDLSSRLGIDPNLLSYILNTHLRKNFYEYINEYRIEELKNRLNQPKYKNYTMLAIALECGFNSKTSFNRIFKQMTGITPSQYKKTLK